MPSKLYSFFLDRIKLVFWECLALVLMIYALDFVKFSRGNSCKNLIFLPGRVNLLTNSRWHTELWLRARSINSLSIFLPAAFRCFKFVFYRFCPELMSCRQLLKTGTERQCLNGNFTMFVQSIPAIFEHWHRRDLGYFASASIWRQEGQVMQTLAQRALSSHDLGEDDAARQLVPGVNCWWKSCQGKVTES